MYTSVILRDFLTSFFLTSQSNTDITHKKCAYNNKLVLFFSFWDLCVCFPLSGEWDGLSQAPQPSSDCALPELGRGVLLAGADWFPLVAWWCNGQHQLRTARDLFPPCAHRAYATRPARRPRQPPEAPAQPAHHQRQHHLRPGPEGLLSNTGVARLLPAAGQCPLKWGI